MSSDSGRRDVGEIGEVGPEAEETENGYTDEEVLDFWVDTESRTLATGVKGESRKNDEGGGLRLVIISGRLDARSAAL